MKLPNIIAIDGPASSGKSTLGEKLADQLGYLFFDTGIMYRAVTFAALKRLNQVTDEKEVTLLAENIDIDVRPPTIMDGRKEDVYLDREDVTWEIRSALVDKNVSRVSAYPGVRVAMTVVQRRIGGRGKVVMVGRDIGTVVLPEAELKIFLVASVEERARRRHAEILERGEDANYDEILEALRKRDRYDSTRTVAPLMAAADAIILNTDGMSIDRVVEHVMGLINMRRAVG